MAHEQETMEEQMDITSSPAAMITIIFLCLLFTGAVAFFGYQTWQFVNWLLPEDSLMMKWLAVINFDVFSYVWLAVGLFLARWTQPLTRTLAVLAGIVTFLLSMGCSIIQIMIASAERFGVNTDSNLVYIAYGFIIVALVWNISTLLGIVHIQWPYISGYHPPKKAKKHGNGFFGFGKKKPAQQTIQASTSVQPSSHTEDLEQLYKSYPEQFAAIVEMIQRQTQSPLQQPRLTPEANQTGTTNGQNGH